MKVNINPTDLDRDMIFSPDGGRTWFTCYSVTPSDMNRTPLVLVYSDPNARDDHAPRTECPLPILDTVTVVGLFIRTEGPDGNAYMVIAQVVESLRRADVPQSMIDALRSRALNSRSYEDLLALMRRSTIAD